MPVVVALRLTPACDAAELVLVPVLRDRAGGQA